MTSSTGRTVIMDVLLVQWETVQALLDKDQAHNVCTAMKGKPVTIRVNLEAIDWSGVLPYETVDKRHSRIETRHCRMVDILRAEWDGQAQLCGRHQTIRTEHECDEVKTKTTTCEIFYALTSSPPATLALV